LQAQRPDRYDRVVQEGGRRGALVDLLGRVHQVAGHAGRERRADLPQASLPGLSIGEGPGALHAELHRGGDQEESQIGLMRSLRRWTAVAACALIGALLPVHAAAPADDSVQLMPLAEVRPGMQGTVRTVFEGERQEEFGAEIIGVMDDFLGPGQDLILARLKGERVEFTGVAGGMSGSPVYIDGKLVGALSYRLGAFPKEPIARVTPCQHILG